MTGTGSPKKSFEANIRCFVYTSRTIAAIPALYTRQRDSKLTLRITHNIPAPRSADTVIFVLRGIWTPHSIQTGNRPSIISESALKIACVYASPASVSFERQLPLVASKARFQKKSVGTH